MTLHASTSPWKERYRRYERHLSAAAMIVGYAVDNFTFGRVDHPGAHLVFSGYLAVAVFSIALAHWLQGRKDRAAQRAPAKGDATRPVEPEPERRFRLSVWLPAATQFALGGLWSGFLVFYSRSAVLAASWPFLLLLLAFLIGNEVFRRYHSRLVFVSLLLFFALYSYAVFSVPVLTRSIGQMTFLASGACAIVAYYFFLRLLWVLDRDRYRQSRWLLIGGAVVITAAMNAFYFTGVLPPLPLALSDVGIYHGIRHTGAVYQVQEEPQPLTVRFGLARPVVHVAAGEKLALYSAVFAPIRMTTRITHLWQWWNSRAKQWQTLSTISFPISGGRAHGYRGYSLKTNLRGGDWRVNIDSADGRLIGQLVFHVVAVSSPVQTETKTLQ
ncbi:MAG TPA: DUF2914 domain-containing protein [Rhizomicrobium sp.]|jgi:hypothetical protein|nr:DUF2914 domain-containing protein [Rhizomicrobium sp.]